VRGREAKKWKKNKLSESERERKKEREGRRKKEIPFDWGFELDDRQRER
jgi:hypothetical protein